MKKRVISGLLALTLVLSGALPIGEAADLPKVVREVEASAEGHEVGIRAVEGSPRVGESFTVGLLTYKVIASGKVEITECARSANSVSIPKTVTNNGYSYKVTSIGEKAFTKCQKLTNVVIPDGVTSVEDFAFNHCVALKSITLPDSVKSIGYSAFYECESLTRVKLSNGLTSIGDNAFCLCTSLESITIPDSVTDIGDMLFSSCTSLTSVTIPSSITAIEFAMFYRCKSLTSVKIPNSVTSIGDNAFAECEDLKSVIIPDSVTSIGTSAFSRCERLKDVYYTGTELDWAEISIGRYNEKLTGAAIHYSFDPNHKHNYTTSRITKQPTCTTKGTKILTCSICGETKTESIPTKAHSYTTKVVAPTYTAQGYTLHTCRTCGKSYKDNYTPKKARTSISKAKISVSTQTYNGKALKPKVTVKVGSKTLRSGADYTVSYKNNKNTGKATVTVTGRNAYVGTKSASFIIKPKKAKLTKVISPKTRQVKLKWKKDSQATGYQIQVALNKKFSSGRKTVNISKKTTTAKTIKSLKKGKKYYARARAYKKVGKTKYYGNWSALKTVRCK